MGNVLFGGPSMIIDRIITAEPYPIYVGVNGAVGNVNNPYKTQVIRVNHGELKSLVSFTETNNSLIYDFEDHIKLQLTKRDDTIIYHIITKDINYTDTMHPIVREHWSPISLESKELDKIGAFIKE